MKKKEITSAKKYLSRLIKFDKEIGKTNYNK
jgi:hypothetical protein